jgi:hypothetical protein
LAFWAGGDAGRIDRLFRQSGLYRPKWDERRGQETYGQHTIATALGGRTEFYQPGEGPAGQRAGLIGCGPLRLRVDGVVKTAKTLTADVAVLLDGREVNLLKISPGRDSREGAARTLVRQHAHVSQEVARKAVDQVLVAAKRRADVQAATKAAGKRLREIVRDEVSASFNPDFRCGKELVWVESLGCEIAREKWIARVLHTVVDPAMVATDAPKNEEGVSRVGVIHACEAELRLCWGRVTESLPDEAGASLGATSKRAHLWRQFLVKLLRQPQTFDIAKAQRGTSGQDRSARASLMTRILKASAPSRKAPQAPPSGQAPHWEPVLETEQGGDAVFSCWWHVTHTGELFVAVGWDLGDQCQPRERPFPGVRDAASLHTIGVRYGAFDPNPPVPVKHLATGDPVACVLVRGLTNELMARP